MEKKGDHRQLDQPTGPDLFGLALERLDVKDKC